jgi:hypothetical protein
MTESDFQKEAQKNSELGNENKKKTKATESSNLSCNSCFSGKQLILFLFGEKKVLFNFNV